MQEGGPDDDEEGIPGHVSESKSDSEEVIPCSLLYLFILVYELRLLVICRLLDNAIMFILQEEELPTGQDSAFFVQAEVPLGMMKSRANFLPCKLSSTAFLYPCQVVRLLSKLRLHQGLLLASMLLVGVCQSNDDDVSPRKQALRAEIKHLRAENLKLKAQVQHRSIYLMWQY